VKVTPRSRTRLLVLVVAALVLVGGGITIGVMLDGGANGTSPSAQSAQLASVRAGCAQWLSSGTTQTGDSQWCINMTGWMAHRMSERAVGPEMMWGGASRTLATCEQWMTASPPGGSAVTPTKWCQEMVGWMAAHVGSWGGQNSPRGAMMGNP
jgi:hypothetical protein